MKEITSALSSLLPVILMLIIGIICRHFAVFSREGINAIKKAVVNICLPAVLVNAFAAMDYSLKNILFSFLMFLFCIAAWALGKLFQSFFGKHKKFIPFITTGFEAGMLGYALFSMLHGTERISEFAVFDLGQVLFVFTLYKILVGLTDDKNTMSARVLFRQMISSPVIIAIIAGMLLGATGLYSSLRSSGISDVIDACTDFISAPTSAMILLAVGYDLVFSDISWTMTCKAVAVRLIIMALVRISFGMIIKALGGSAGYLDALTVMCILPPPYVLPVFSDDAEQRTFLSSAITVSTLVTIIGFSVLVVLQ